MNTDEYKLSEKEFILAKDYIQGNLFVMKNAFSDDINTLKGYIADRPFYFNGHQGFLALKCLIELKENGIQDLSEIDSLSSTKNVNISGTIDKQNTKIDELQNQSQIQQKEDLEKANDLVNQIKTPEIVEVDYNLTEDEIKLAKQNLSDSDFFLNFPNINFDRTIESIKKEIIFIEKNDFYVYNPTWEIITMRPAYIALKAILIMKHNGAKSIDELDKLYVDNGINDESNTKKENIFSKIKNFFS